MMIKKGTISVIIKKDIVDEHMKNYSYSYKINGMCLLL